MESNPPDASLASGDEITSAHAEIVTINLPLTHDEITEIVQRFEDHLILTSRAAASQGVNMDFKVTITSHTSSRDTSEYVLHQANIPMPPNTDIADRDAARAGVLMTGAVALDPTASNQGILMQEPHSDVAQINADDEDRPQENEEVDSAMPGCKICMDNLTPDTVVTINCGCTYCVTCLNAHILHGLNNRAFFPARCCGQDGIDLKNVEPYLSDEVSVKWSMVEGELNERLPMFCANRECSLHIPTHRLDLSEENKFINCNTCNVETCRECRQVKAVHTGDNEDVCPEDLVSKEDRELMNTEKWKQCPGCKNLIERTEGCNNMACGCGTEFCYDCGVEFSDDHRCGCHTIPDEDGYHHRANELPDDLANDINPRDTMTHQEFIERLGRAMYRADREVHGRFESASDAELWLWDQEEPSLWDRLDDNDQILAFQAYERIRADHEAQANDPTHGWDEDSDEDAWEDEDSDESIDVPAHGSGW